jgi:hypothetical protein
MAFEFAPPTNSQIRKTNSIWWAMFVLSLFFVSSLAAPGFSQNQSSAQPDTPVAEDSSTAKSGADGAARAASNSSTTADANATEKNALQKKLAKYLTNTRWTGQFTMTGQDGPPKAEQYEITKAEKADEGDYWNLVVRIKYGDHDMTLPLPPIEVKWAGETPVITVDQVTVPGLGTFDARVLIRGGQYAGVWKHDAVGGHLFGKIEKMKP